MTASADTPSCTDPLAALYAQERRRQEEAQERDRELEEAARCEREQVISDADDFLNLAFPQTLARYLPRTAWTGHNSDHRTAATAHAPLGEDGRVHYRAARGGDGPEKVTVDVPCHCGAGHVTLAPHSEEHLLDQLANHNAAEPGEDQRCETGACRPAPHF